MISCSDGYHTVKHVSAFLLALQKKRSGKRLLSFLAPHRTFTETCIEVLVVSRDESVTFGGRNYRAEVQKLAYGDKGVALFLKLRHEHRQCLGGVVPATIGVTDNN